MSETTLDTLLEEGAVAGPAPDGPAEPAGVDYLRIYQEHAAPYDRLVRAEDCEGNLLPALAAVAEIAGASILEVGAGTGRLTRLLAPTAARVLATERSWPMLAVACGHTHATGEGVHYCCAEAEAIPVRDSWADLAVAGWVFGHFREWMPSGWKEAVSRALGEMRRVLRPGGTLVILETLGTGVHQPAPPTPGLAEYYAWLEGDQELERRVVRTDYAFADNAEAAELTGFFFGGEMGERVRREGERRVPEFTGLWWGRE